MATSKNDYCQHFVDTGERPQNYIRDIQPEDRFQDYPKLEELIKSKDDLVKKRATPPTYIRADLKEFNFDKLGKFDVIMIDPPWEEYSKRKRRFDIIEPYWSFEEIASLPIDQIAESYCFLFIWVGAENLDNGRALFRKWGFKRCEDIVWLKTNKNLGPEQMLSSRVQQTGDTSSVLQRVKEHCLVGLKGDVRRASDSYFIHANIDTDVIVDEEPPFGSTAKPKEIYYIIERFCLGRKRIELFGGPKCVRGGWLTIGNDIQETNYDPEKYQSWFENDRYVGTTPEIENLRPKSPKSNSNQAAKDDLPDTKKDSSSSKEIGDTHQNTPNKSSSNKGGGGGGNSYRKGGNNKSLNFQKQSSRNSNTGDDADNELFNNKMESNKDVTIKGSCMFYKNEDMPNVKNSKNQQQHSQKAKQFMSQSGGGFFNKDIQKQGY